MKAIAAVGCGLLAAIAIVATAELTANIITNRTLSKSLTLNGIDNRLKKNRDNHQYDEELDYWRRHNTNLQAPRYRGLPETELDKKSHPHNRCASCYTPVVMRGPQLVRSGITANWGSQ